MSTPQLPLIARALLRVLPLGSQRPEINADLKEAFDRRVATNGLRAAKRAYRRDVISLLTHLPGRMFSRPRPSRWPGDAIADVGYALRVFRRQPGPIAIAVTGLGVAIAVCTAIFSLLNAVIIRPYPMDRPEQVYRISRVHETGMSTAWAYSDFLTLRRGATLAAVHATLFDAPTVSDVADDARPGTQPISFVSDGYLEMLGGRAAYGRLLGASDAAPGAAPAAVASYRFWERRLRADPSIVGKTVWVAEEPVTIVGVLGPGIAGPTDRPPSLFLSFAAYETIYREPRAFAASSVRGVTVFARLGDASTRDQAQAELRALSPALTLTTPGRDVGPMNGLYPRLDPADDRLGGPQADVARIVLAVIFTVIGLVLLLACANVTNLQVASAMGRRREFGMRLALGAGRGRLVRQLMVESLLLGAVGGAAGYVLTLIAMPWLAVVALVPDSFDISADWRVYAFLVVVSAIAGLGAGLAPARLAARADVIDSAAGRVTDAAHGPTRLRSLLVGGQATASILLLVLAALLTRAMARSATIDLGFQPAGLVAVSASFPRTDEGQARARRYLAEAPARARAVPGVTDVAVAAFAPFSGGSQTGEMLIDGRPLLVHFNFTTADYFSVLRLPIAQGRGYSADDIAARAPVAVITANLARRLFGTENPIGQPLTKIRERATVIGVVDAAVTARLVDADAATIYQPLTDDRLDDAQLIVRADAGAAAVMRPLERAMREINPDLRASATLVIDGVDAQLREPRAIAAISGAVGLVALGLAVIGLYGVTALAVSQRTREIGVRMAIGATAGDVRGLMVRESLKPVLVGLTIGLALALLAGQVLAGVLFGVSPRDPIAIASATLILSLASGAAAAIPAGRTARIDPARTLRAE